MEVLFVTSFAADMYRSTGTHLIKSYESTGMPWPLLVCHEGGIGNQVRREHPSVLAANLDHSVLLRDWLAANRDIIPPALGGTASRCECARSSPSNGMHRNGCCWGWFNRNASRWFRKIASLDCARQAGCDVVVWLDSDCRFRKAIPPEEIVSWFGTGALFYLKGPRRQVVESGVLGFRFGAGGGELLDNVICHYRTGAFRQDVRWDDGYQFTLALDRCPQLRRTDLGGAVTGTGHVVAQSRLGAYIEHNKGCHKYAGVMR